MKYLLIAIFFCASIGLPAQERSGIKPYAAPAVPGGVSFPFSPGVTKAPALVPLAEETTPASDASDASDASSGASGASDTKERPPWLYLGLRAGGSFGWYCFQPTSDYNPGNNTGIAVEGGLVVELRLFSFFSLQMGGEFIYEVFNAPRTVLEEGTLFIDTFTIKSLMFPLVMKVPLKFERFVLSLYAGAYYNLFLWDAEKVSGNSGEKDSAAVNMLSPLGLTVGIDIGFPVGPGELFVDFRYGVNPHAASIGENASPLYIKDRAVVCLGYKFGIGGKKPAPESSK
ncbi:MAG: outer membrane beta-barrel protein [Treponema sp.]|nr:outer membrane beta-barrel protein [Treponema sp.]